MSLDWENDVEQILSRSGVENKKQAIISFLSVHLGVDSVLLNKLSYEQLHHMLGFVVQYLKSVRKALFVENDQSSEVEESIDSHAWKLEAKGVLKKRRSNFANMPPYIHLLVKLLASQRAFRRIRPDNGISVHPASGIVIPKAEAAIRCSTHASSITSGKKQNALGM